MGIGKIIRRLLLLLLLVIVVINWTWGKIPSQPATPSASTFVEYDGKKIFYEEKVGREPAVLMVHGLPGTHYDWKPVADQLKGRHTITIDRPGFGWSTGGGLAFNEQVKAMHAIALKLRLKDPVIAGHSYGGTLALAYARAYPDDTRSLVLVAPAVDSDDLSAFEYARAGFVWLLGVPVIKQVANVTFSQAMRTYSAETGAKEAFDPEPVAAGYEDHLLEFNMQAEDLRAFADELLNFAPQLDQVEPNAKQIETPTYIVQGRDDQLVTASGPTELAKIMPNAHLTLLPGGHMQTYTHTDRVAGVVTRASR